MVTLISKECRTNGGFSGTPGQVAEFRENPGKSGTVGKSGMSPNMQGCMSPNIQGTGVCVP